MSRFVTGRRVGAVLATMALSTTTLAVVATGGAGASAHHAKTKHSFSAPTTSSSTTSSTTTTTLSHDVLTVGTYANKPGQYQTIQAAVDAAKPGDTILVAPGDYKETADLTNWNDATAAHGGFGAVLVTTPHLTIRGLNRNTTIIDGTKGAGTLSLIHI